MSQFKRILVPVDFSPCSDAAVEHAWQLGRVFGAEIHLVYVWKPSLFTATAESPGLSLTSFAATEAGDRMKGCLERLEGKGARVMGRLEQGDPEHVILELASRDGYDLIVMGTHGRTGVAHLVRGSVAEHVVRRAPCPVLTIHAPVEANSAPLENTGRPTQPLTPWFPGPAGSLGNGGASPRPRR
jgi:nucleotide-binding universal stress UspA family protein